MKKIVGVIALLALGCGLSLRALAQVHITEMRAVTKSDCEQMADAQMFGSDHSGRHWFVLRCMTQS